MVKMKLHFAMIFTKIEYLEETVFDHFDITDLQSIIRRIFNID